MTTDTVQLRAEYGAIFDEVVEALFDTDPLALNFGTNTDEYEPEATTIVPRLRACASLGRVRTVVHEAFVHWFGAEHAGPQASYQEAAERIWAVWRRRRAA